MRTLIKTSVVLLLSMSAVLVVAFATTLTPRTQRPTIHRAFDLIETFPSQVPVNTRAVFKLKASEGARKIVRGGLLVRIFSLTSDQTIPMPLTVIDECDVYLSVTHSLVAIGDDEIGLKTVAALNQDWLNLSNSLRSVEPGHYYFVFEQADSALTGSEQFRIRSVDAKGYFSTGFRVTINAKGSDVSAEALRQQYLAREARLGRLKTEADSRSHVAPCFSYQPIVVRAQVSDEPSQGYLHACAEAGTTLRLSS